MASKAATHYLQFDIQWSSLGTHFRTHLRKIGDANPFSALLFYDYALTFPSEVKYIWGSKMRLSTFLYIFCRYALVANVLYLLAIANQLKQGASDVWGRQAIPFLDVRSSKRANLLLSILMVIFEYSSAILTITRSLMAFRVGGRKQHAKGLMNLIFEQGVLYFRLSGLLTARFLLHIRAYEHARSLATQTQTGASRHHATGTLASFRAAAGGAMSSMVDQFGDDPVEAAQRQAQAEASGVTTMAAGSNSTDGPSEISLVRRKSGSIQDHSASTSAV
ncbi:hypothetical protein PC9H_002027 [Pleurotus ostreatus]|uniref:DUF6533 domain-containing protein n=1 Tax=Pleurotus ostreatus TaxID=5322 RepID=A0A8H7DMQ5_PLEOS|nr:uncharacterized protein PC9H_002027 [Pleurotus ostreatus]KAF7419437.1 hypothetical protein PC9H_002027 [Pleurotus ostreatus]